MNISTLFRLQIKFTTVSILFFLISDQAGAATQSLNLEQAIQYAITHSPTLDSAKRDANINDLEKESSFSRFLPTLDFSTTDGLQKTSPTTQTTSAASSVDLKLSENIYDNGQNLTRYKISKLRNEQSQINYLKSRDLLCRDVALEFLHYSLVSRMYEIQKEQRDLFNKQYESVYKEYRQGLKSRKDFLKFKTEVSRADIDLLNAKNDFEKSKQELIRLLAVPLDSTDEITILPDDGKIGDVTLPKETPSYKNHYEFRAAALQKEMNKLEADLIRRQYYPEVFFTTGASYHSADFIDTGASLSDNRVLSWNALVTLNYNLWDWQIRKRNALVAEERQKIQSNDQDSRLLEVRSEIERLMIDLKQLKENFTLSNELLALEQNNMTLFEREYRNGKAQYLDVITGLKDLADAKVKYFTALYDLKRGLFSYRYHEGTLYDSLVKK
jgi:outer membrane protein TolC